MVDVVVAEGGQNAFAMHAVDHLVHLEAARDVVDVLAEHRQVLGVATHGNAQIPALAAAVDDLFESTRQCLECVGQIAVGVQHTAHELETFALDLQLAL